MNRKVNIVILLLSVVSFFYTTEASSFSENTDLAIAKAALSSQYGEPVDSAQVYKVLAVASVKANHKKNASLYIDEYIKRTADLSILNNDAFDSIKNSIDFELITEKYAPKLNLFSFIYFYIALIGFFIALIICFTKKTDKIAKRLIAAFVTIHSLFILEFVCFYSNYSFVYPDTYLMSSIGALLYGPLLYLYFKRITQNYQLRARDVWHFLPTVILFIVLLPVYSLPIEEKIKIQLDSSEIYTQKDFIFIIFIPKLISLIVYGFFISKLYLKNRAVEPSTSDSVIEFWKRGIYRMHIIYVISYFIYGISVSGLFFAANEVLYHSQVIAMSSMVLYVAAMAYIQPKVFSLEAYQLYDESSGKYQKSSLTETFSLELKEKLMELLIDKKIYKDNSINLEKLSTELNTSRHNTSQIINEHFNENFYEFLNDYRIQEAKELLLKKNGNKMNVAEILYEVGFNNKVSFNNAFKKRTGLTPTQFRNEKQD